jgi:hypothetical protein
MDMLKGAKMATVEGQTVKIGDCVGFKSDVEQYGEIVAIHRNTNGHWILTLENTNGFSGDYIGGETRTQERADDCWID